MARVGDVRHLRDLMHAPSLESVFSQLVLQEDTGRVAEQIAQAIQLN